MNTIELISRVVIKRDGKILLCKGLEQGNLYLPGGHVEFGDTMVETVYKELNEEMGLNRNEIHNLQYHDMLENFYGSENDKRHEVNFIFSATISPETEIKSMESHIDFEWVDIHELENVNFMPTLMIPKIKNI